MAQRPPGPTKVVVPVDGSDDSLRAIPLASRLSALLGSELVLVSVISDFRSEAPTLVGTLREQLRDLPPSVERRVVQSRTVATTIAEESTDGIVCIATTAQVFDDDGFRHTITDGVIAAATSPVIVLGPACPDDPPITRIVVAIDTSHDQEGLAFWATRLGYQLAVPVDMVHVVDGPSGPELALGPKVRLLPGAPDRPVADRLLEESTDALLAMGSHGRTGFRRLIQGSVGAAVIADARSPVLVLGPNAARDPDAP